MAVWVIKRRYPNMPEDEVDKRACQIVPTSLSGVEIIDPKTFYLDTRSKAASKVRRWFKGGGEQVKFVESATWPGFGWVEPFMDSDEQDPLIPRDIGRRLERDFLRADDLS